MAVAVASSSEERVVSARRLTWLQQWLVLSWLVLIAATWRLWTPQVVFPQIPFFGWLRDVPGWVDWVALGGLVIGLTGWGLLSFRRRSNGRQPAPLAPDPSPRGEGDRMGRVSRRLVLLAVSATAVLVLLNQHRFQPWAYQFAVVALVLAFVPATQAASLLRVLTVGIYFWSAVSKLDYTFLHGLGPELLRGALAALGLEPRWMRADVATLLAWTFPIDELSVAVLLAIRRTRTFGLVGAVAMHVLLLAALGPLGLNHSTGVLLWNVYFIGQNLLLFKRPAAGWRRTAGPGAGTRLREIARGMLPPASAGGVGYAAVYAAVWLPVLEPFGWLDHWPGWAVYAPGGERVTLLVGMDGLPPGLQRHLGQDDFPAEWRALRADSWSLEAVSAPVYPQDRFRGGVALTVVERFGLDDAAVLIIENRADRFTGKRTRSRYAGAEEIRRFAKTFTLNALPRKLGGW